MNDEEIFHAIDWSSATELADGEYDEVSSEQGDEIGSIDWSSATELADGEYDEVSSEQGDEIGSIDWSAALPFLHSNS